MGIDRPIRNDSDISDEIISLEGPGGGSQPWTNAAISKSIVEFPGHLLPNGYAIEQSEVPADSSGSGSPTRSSPTVRDVVLRSEPSTRLHNAVINNALLNEWTAHQALTEPDAFWNAILELPNVGRTTALELVELLATAAGDNFANLEVRFPIEAEAEDTASHPAIGAIDESVLSITIAEILRFSEVSTRLSNAIIRSDFDTLSLADYLAKPAALAHRLRGLPGTGKKTVAEALVIIEEFVAAAANGELSVHHMLAGISPAGAGDEKEGVRTSVAHDPRPARVRFEEIVSLLGERERYVLMLRYGLSGMPRRTLQEVAETVHVTRERIRQLEAKALRRLAHARHQRLLAEFLRDERDVIWAVLSGGNGLISQSELRETTRLLGPWHLLAIDIAFGSVREWVEADGVAVGSSWMRPDLDHQHIAAAAELLTRLVSDKPQPIPRKTVELLLGIPAASIDHAVEHAPGVQAYQGYVFSGRAGTRLRRLIDLHRLATSIASDGLFDLVTLVAEYRRCFPDDAVAPRIFQMHLEESPHLFCRLHDSIWFVVPAAADDDISSPPYERLATLDPAFDAGSIGAKIASQLQAGPRRHVDLRVSVPDALKGLVAASSIGAVLLSNPCFRRVSPGIFDICRVGDVYNEAGMLGTIFLNERQCQTYCLARYGGAPIAWYPAWGPSLELWMARWARLEAPPELFSSLMFVAELDTWSAPADELAFWRRTQEHERAWMLGSPRRFQLGRRFLDADQVLPTLAQLAFCGWTSWMAVNRTTDARLDIHDAADVLAILIKAGLVTAPDDWQGPHHATPSARDWFARVCSEMHHNGDLDWERGALADLWAELERSVEEPASGWLDNSEFLEALDAWRSGDARSSRSFARKAAEPIDPEPIFESGDWSSLFRS